jgi:hypothetical protein
MLRPLNGWRVASTGRFETRAAGHEWTVDVDFLDFDRRLRLYRDRELIEVQTSPASFRLGPAASIEVEMGVFGMRRIDLVADGQTTILTPVEGRSKLGGCGSPASDWG